MDTDQRRIGTLKALALKAVRPLQPPTSLKSTAMPLKVKLELRAKPDCQNKSAFA